MRVSNGHAGSMRRHFLVFFSITVISGLLCSSVLSVCMGKSHKILHSSDSNTFSGLCVYHLSDFSNLHFPHSFQWITFATLSCLTCLYSFCTSFWHSATICATVSSAEPHTLQVESTFSPYPVFLIFLLQRA